MVKWNEYRTFITTKSQTENVNFLFRYDNYSLIKLDRSANYYHAHLSIAFSPLADRQRPQPENTGSLKTLLLKMFSVVRKI